MLSTAGRSGPIRQYPREIDRWPLPRAWPHLLLRRWSSAAAPEIGRLYLVRRHDAAQPRPPRRGLVSDHQSDRARTGAGPDHGGELQGQRAKLEALAGRQFHAHKARRGRGAVQCPPIFHDQSESVRPWEIAQRLVAAQPHPPRRRFVGALPPRPHPRPHQRRVGSITGRRSPSSTLAPIRCALSSMKVSRACRCRSSTKRCWPVSAARCSPPAFSRRRPLTSLLLRSSASEPCATRFKSNESGRSPPPPAAMRKTAMLSSSEPSASSVRPSRYYQAGGKRTSPGSASSPAFTSRMALSATSAADRLS